MLEFFAEYIKKKTGKPYLHKARRIRYVNIISNIDLFLILTAIISDALHMS